MIFLYVIILLLIIAALTILARKEIEECGIRILLIDVFLIFIYIFKGSIDLMNEIIIILSTMLFIFFFRIRFIRSIYLIIIYFFFIEFSGPMFISLLPILACNFIQDKNYFSISYLLISSFHFYLAFALIPDYTIFPTLLFLTLNFLMMSSDFAAFQKITVLFKKNYYLAQVLLKNAEEGESFLIDLPHVTALNLNSSKGIYQVKYLLPMSRNKLKLQKMAQQVEFILHSKLGETELIISKVDFKSQFNRKFYEFKIGDNSEDIISYFKTLSNKIPLNMDLYACYEKLKLNGVMPSFERKSYNHHNILTNRGGFQAQQLEALTLPTESNYSSTRDYLVKARIFLSIENNKEQGKQFLINNFLEVKPKFFLYNKILTNKITLNNLLYSSDFPVLSTIVPKMEKNEDIYLASDRDRKNSIILGNLVENSRETQRPYHFKIDDFAKGAILLGSSGTGKTYLQGYIVKEITRKRENIGILVINLTKSGQHDYYNNLDSLELDEFKIPYYPYLDEENSAIEKTIMAMESSKYIAGSLGLKNVLEIIIYDVLLKSPTPPKTIQALFKLVIKHLKEKPYDGRLTNNFIQAIENRLSAFVDTGLMDLFSIDEKGKYPAWFEAWLSGKSFFVNLKAPQNIQRFAIFALLNLIRHRLGGEEVNHLRNLIMIDEAHVLSGPPPNRLSVDDDELITFNLQTQLFTNLINEFRSRGLSIILADQREETLEFARTTGLKVLFRTRITGEYLDENMLKSISRLRNRHAIILSENEMVQIRTPDFYVTLSKKSELKEKEILHT